MSNLFIDLSPQALLYYKGYHALQTQRIAHALYKRGQVVMARLLHSRISEVRPRGPAR